MKPPYRKIRVVGELAFVPLTKGLEAVVDAKYLPLIENRPWYAKVDNHGAYAKTDINGKSVFMHRVICDADAGLYVDHKDGDGLNNTRKNLREATPSQNMHNRKKNKNNSSGYKGVNFDFASKKWRARIKINGVERSLGLHRCPTSAAVAYARASAQYHNEFGRLT